MKTEKDRLVNAALARLPQWQPPPGFAQRVATLSAASPQKVQAGWVPVLLHGLGIAACVSVAAWLVAEVLAAWLSSTGPERQGSVIWTLAAVSLLFAWRMVRRQYGPRA